MLTLSTQRQRARYVVGDSKAGTFHEVWKDFCVDGERSTGARCI